MRRAFPTILLSAVGCWSPPSPAPTAQPLVVVYQDKPSAALVYPAPAGEQIASIILDRSQRAPRAFLGYETLVQEYFWLRTDDRMRFGKGNHDRFERRAVSTRVGVLER